MTISRRNALAGSTGLLSAVIGITNTWAQAAPAQGKPVKIGVLNDMSGPYADITGQSSLIAVQMAVEDYGGKVLGRPIEVVSADHQNKPDLGLAIAREWYDRDGVGVIIGVGSSAVALAIRSFTRDNGRLDIYTTTGTSTLTGSACSPTGFHWMHDTYALSKVMANAVVRAGGDTWYIVAVDYAFGHDLERDVTRFVKEAGGRVLGSVFNPINSMDFSSYLLQAQASGAKIIGLANGGNDLVNSVKSAREFGMGGAGSKQALAGFLVMVTDVHAMGLELAQGLLLTEAFYWDMTEAAGPGRSASSRAVA
jgi:branched-chain amino acid transport system substrate-binding protein